VAATDLKAMGEAIAQGLEAGKDPYAISRTLDMIQGLDNVRAGKLQKYADDLATSGLSPAEVDKRVEAMRQSLLKDRRDNIARTETANAIEAAQAEQARAGGKQWKIWITAGDGRVSDVCRTNEAAGWIGIDKTFPAGQDRPPGHPNCRCACGYKTDKPDKDDIAEAKARAERTEAAAEGEGEGNARS
jgi:SPP1 gp7 family putative phage head morphogenesis protein